ncbi:MAG: ParB/RepB/Spo0J family partition protein [Gammaproteobacteria bacterium]|nr:ParB/RepB/Spo0J family partition protein [Gammaproteobacteria bacterium]
MPKIEEIKEKPGFVKKEYRPWDGAPSAKIVQTPNLKHSDHVEESLNGSSNIEFTSSEKIYSIDPSEIFRWEHKDRPSNELGDLDEFARTLKQVGQVQPGIVRISTKPGLKYELIVGERRWLACKLAGISFQTKISELSDKQASLVQAIENEDRETLTDYARGISYADKIKAGILTQKDLSDELGKSKQEISRLLSFREIPLALINAIGDMRKVSAYTAETLKQLCKKDPNNTDILIEYADKIASGYGNTSIERHVAQAKDFINIEDPANEKIFSKTGRHLYSWRKDGNGNRSISFPKDIRKLISPRTMNEALTREIEKQLHSMESPVDGTEGIK